METQLVLLLLLGLYLSPVAHGCDEGFVNDNGCKDDNECEHEPPVCGEYARCINTRGSYYCNCYPGFSSSKVNFTGEDSGCKDINECSEKKNACGPDEKCINTLGSYKCECQDGYRRSTRGDQDCQDVDECAMSPPVCGPNGSCTNTPGSYTCTCPPGFRNHDISNTTTPCEDVNECEDPVCGPNGACTNTPGSYTCTCQLGFHNQGNTSNGTCEDVDECKEKAAICGPNSTCTNINGSYTCSCVQGFKMSTVTGYCEVLHGSKECNEGFYVEDGECRDDNECDTVPVYPSLCGEHAQCLNTKGSYYCECEEGYQSPKGPKFTADDPKCQDIDECKTVNICGLPSEGICSNTNGSYICLCEAEHSNYGNPQGRCTKITCDGYGDDGSKEQGGALGRLWGKMRANCKGLSSGQGKPDHSAAHGLLEDVLTGTDDFLSSAGDMADSSKMTGLLTMMEKAMMLIGPQLKENKTTMETNYTEAELAVKRGKTAPTGHVELATDNASFKTNWETASGNGIYPGFTVAALVSYRGINSTPASSLESLKESLKEEMEAKSREEVQEEEEDNKGRRRVKVDLEMVSNVVTACVSNPDTHSLAEPVTFTFKHTNTPKQDQKKNMKVGFECVFWDSGVWSQRGCVKIQSNDTHTTCSCNHLSSFAVLMALYDIKHTFELRLLTWIGLAVSLFCLVLCILTFGFCRSIRGTRTTIHLHLSICLFMADLIFLCGISQAGEPGCGLVAALLHYFFLAAFAWMLLEGVQLYRMVVLVFHTSLRPLHMIAAGYAGPLAVVIMSAIANPQGYGTDQHCWLSLENGFIWAFFGPVCIIILLNAFFFLITLWRLAQKLSSLNPDLTHLQMIRGFTVTAVAQLCVLGGMWVFGCFMFTSVAMVYLFTILNSLQGALLFVMHCLLSKPVREEYAKFLRCICSPEKRRYTDYTSNPSSNNSQQPLRTATSTGQSNL